MMPRLIHPSADIAADPFHEHPHGLLRIHRQVLGGVFEFATESPQLLRLVRWAYDGLPRHRLSTAPTRIKVRLMVGGRMEAERTLRSARARGRMHEPAPFAMISAPGLLCGASDCSTVAVMSPERRTALIVVARELLRFPYHVRYELIELAVFTLAARVQELMPLHAACVGRGRRGLLLIGDSGAGKSTAVLHCALEGLDVVSEDSLFVAPRALLATGVANFLHVRRESLRFLSAADASLIRGAPVIRRRSGVRKFEVDLRQRRFRLAPRPLEIQGLVALCAGSAAGGEPQLVPLAPAEADARLRASQPYAVSQPGWRIFAERMRSVPAFELRRGRHPRDSIAALRQLLHGQ
ncbi:MAG: serine kinase [Gammaproteobacteria bacterium]|nr:serine kinase [Gammaproteobacteria bacterium]